MTPAVGIQCLGSPVLLKTATSIHLCNPDLPPLSCQDSFESAAATLPRSSFLFLARAVARAMGGAFMQLLKEVRGRGSMLEVPLFISTARKCAPPTLAATHAHMPLSSVPAFHHPPHRHHHHPLPPTPTTPPPRHPSTILQPLPPTPPAPVPRRASRPTTCLPWSTWPVTWRHWTATCTASASAAQCPAWRRSSRGPGSCARCCCRPGWVWGVVGGCGEGTCGRGRGGVVAGVAAEGMGSGGLLKGR